jgi:hypothetical protein
MSIALGSWFGTYWGVLLWKLYFFFLNCPVFPQRCAVIAFVCLYELSNLDANFIQSSNVVGTLSSVLIFSIKGIGIPSIKYSIKVASLLILLCDFAI